jgi:hypothetical protein
MGKQRQCLMDVSSAGFTFGTVNTGPDVTPRSTLSEFERAQTQRITEEGAILAAAVIRWHREQSAIANRTMSQHLAHGLGVAALGALVMQILAWSRLVEPAELPPDTLRVARDVIETPDPEPESSVLETQARGLLIHALEIKAKARRISRLW